MSDEATQQNRVSRISPLGSRSHEKSGYRQVGAVVADNAVFRNDADY
jgi:hypothetical protein